MKNEEIMFKKIIRLVKKSAKIYHNKTFYERNDKYKFEFDDVTNRDIEVQNFILKNIKKIVPDVAIISEEGIDSSGKEFCFILDPIDGTFNYKHKIPNYGTQICLLKNGMPIFSCIFLPSTNDLYYSYNGKSYKNKKEINVSNQTNLKDMVIAFGDYQSNEDIKKQCQIMNILAKNLKRIRMFGSSCVDSCYLASGKVDAYIIFTKNIWDLKPGELLIKNANGVCFTNKEQSINIYGKKENVINIVKLLTDVDNTFEEKF